MVNFVAISSKKIKFTHDNGSSFGTTSNVSSYNLLKTFVNFISRPILLIEIILLLFISINSLQASPTAINLMQAYQLAYNNSPLLKSQHATSQSQLMNQDIQLGYLLPNIYISFTPNRTNNWEETSSYPKLVIGRSYTASLNQVVLNFQRFFSYTASKKDGFSALTC